MYVNHGVARKIEHVSEFFDPLVQVVTGLKLAWKKKENFDKKIVIVAVDNESIDKIGRWPWHRDVVAVLIDRIFQSKAAYLALDIVFSETDVRVPEKLQSYLKTQKNIDTAQFETDLFLAKELAKYHNQIVLGWVSDMVCQPAYDKADECAVLDPESKAYFQDSIQLMKTITIPSLQVDRTPLYSFVAATKNIPLFQDKVTYVGILNALLDSDGIIRRFMLGAMAGGKLYPSLSVAMAMAAGKKIEVGFSPYGMQELMVDGKQIPVSASGAIEMHVRGSFDQYKTISALDVLTKNEPFEDLKDAHVFLGVSAIGVYDMRGFPLNPHVPGVYGHAAALDTLLSANAYSDDAFFVVIACLVLGGLFIVMMMRLTAKYSIGSFLVLMIFLMIGDVSIFSFANSNLNTAFLYIELLGIFTLLMVSKYLHEEASKKFVRSAFSKYVSSHVVDALMEHPEELRLGGEKKELTILFSDIRGFTTFSEKMDAKQLAAFLNDYLGVMTKIVFDHQGTLDKYIGDALMAFWGAPLPVANHAAQALRAARAMLEALELHKERFSQQYGVSVAIGIGVHSGVVNVGNMGSDQAFSYTVIGDHVNLASRLESLTKTYCVALLSTRATVAAAMMQEAFMTLDFVCVKGKTQAIEIMGLDLYGVSAIYAQAFDAYRHRHWEKAIDLFDVCAAQGDKTAAMMRERTKGYQISPPGDDWEGAMHMDSK